MTEVQDAIARLDGYRAELDELSRALNQILRDLEPVEVEYDAFVDEFQIGLYESALAEGSRLPAEAMQVRLARRDMPPGLLGRFEGLRRKRERLKIRIGDLKVCIEAERSILSAEKTVASV